MQTTAVFVFPLTMARLLMFVGAVLCSLTVSAEVVPQGDINLQEMAGKWYLIGFATNAQWFTQRTGNMNMGTALFTPSTNGDLDVSYASLRTDGTCWRMKNQAKKTDVSGKFSYTSDNWGGEYDMLLVEVKYDEYALTHTIKTNEGDTTVINKLYGRRADLGPDLLEKFKQFSTGTGILPENIAILPNNGECQEA
ncbi:lipocalin [Cynoglossus semilaevis]|uniref:lipocalin n=1 Tax=Cynoglossus semilaevis TaxID=244447 RepID=UPI0007DCB24D|nr:lipocalin-like [Cynoglossus semilaevis]